MPEETSSPTLEEFGATLERLKAGGPEAIEAAIDRRLARKLGCKPDDVDSVLVSRD